MIRILLAEDMTMVRGALLALLQLEPDIEVVAEVESGNDIVPEALRLQPDVAVLDIDLPGIDGLTAAAQLHEQLPSCRCLILTSLGRPGNLRRAMAAHVAGFILKDVRGLLGGRAHGLLGLGHRGERGERGDGSASRARRSGLTRSCHSGGAVAISVPVPAVSARVPVMPPPDRRERTVLHPDAGPAEPLLPGLAEYVVDELRDRVAGVVALQRRDRQQRQLR